MRGAAVLGAIFLGIAGILLFQYSVQHNLITPEMRVGMGIGGGILGLIGSVILRRKGFVMTANGLAAGSVVVLYSAFWAGHAVLALYAMKVAFAAMAAVTALCCFLSLRYRSQLIAVLGLLGGFATPLALMSSLDNPLGLFGYILLLDLGFVFLGQRRGWSSMGLVGIVGTALIEAFWIGRNLDAEHVTFGLAVLGVFAVLFALAGSGEVKQKRRWLVSQAGGVLMPFLFAGYFASRVEMTPYLLPLAGLAALLSLAALFVARREGTPWLPLGAASGSTALLLVWLFSTVPNVGGFALPLVIVAIGLALLFHAFVEWPLDPSRESSIKVRRGLAAAGAFANGGMLLTLIFAGVFAADVSVWPWIAGLVGIVLINARLSAKSELAPLQLAGGLGLAIGLSCMHAARSRGGSFPTVEAYYVVLLSGGLLFAALAFLRRGLGGSPSGADGGVTKGVRWAWVAAGVYALVTLPMTGLSGSLYDTEPELVLGATMLMGLGAAFAASRARSTWLFSGAVVVSVLYQMNWIGEHTTELRNGDKLLIALALLLATATALVTTPAIFRSAFGASRWAHRVPVLGTWFLFFPAHYLFETHFGDAAIGVLPVLFAVPFGLAALGVARDARETSQTARPSSLAWCLGAAGSFLALAVPLQVDTTVVPIALVLFGAITFWLWRRLAHGPLLVPAFAATLLGALILCGLALTPRTFERSDARFLNLMSYAYLVPATAAIVSAWLLNRRKAVTPDASPGKRRIARLLSVLTGLVGLAGIALVFSWITLTIFNAWESGNWVRVSFRRLQTRDLVLSITWAVYALSLLGLGMGRKIGTLRWVSLGLLLITIGKVFLFDLGNLDGLHRVGSMFGLAMSLLLVSFLYQRFVFRQTRTA